MINIPFHIPNFPENIEDVFSESVKSGWLTTGSQVHKLEEKLTKFLDVKYVVAVNSCTAALHLSLAAKGFGLNDKFIIPTLTFASTIECGEYLGMEPVLVDSSEDGFLIDLNQIEDLVKNDRSIKAIVPMHYGGEPVDLENSEAPKVSAESQIILISLFFLEIIS